MTGEADQRWSKLQAGSNGDRRRLGDSSWEKPGWGLGKVEEVLGTMLAQGIEVWWPEEGDRRKEGDDGASGRAPLVTGRSGEEEE